MRKMITAFTTILILSSIFYVAPAKADFVLRHSWQYGGETGSGCYFYRDVYTYFISWLLGSPSYRKQYKVFIYSPGFGCPTKIAGW